MVHEEQATNLSGLLCRSFTLPAVGVRTGVRVAIVTGHVRQHGIQHTGVLYTKENQYVTLVSSTDLALQR